MWSHFSQVIIIIPLLVAVAACEVTDPSVPAQVTASSVAGARIESPQPELEPTASSGQSETSVPELSVTPASQSNDDKQIAALLDHMESAVMAQNRDLYLSYVDLSDPIFALEHSRWADEWSQQAVVY